MKKSLPQNQIFLLCILLTPLINIALDIYTPSLPAIAHAFHVSHNAVNATLLIYTITFGITQPIIGPICDRIGRQPFVWIALLTYLAASFGASISPNIYLLCLARFGQGVGAAIIAACIKAIMVDCFHGKKLAKANSYFSLSWSLTPIVAPAIGGYLQHYISWQASFYFMASYCFVCIIFAKFFLIETAQIRPARSGGLKNITQTWKILLTDKTYLSCAFILTSQFSIIILYYLCAPYVLQKQLHMNAAEYGQIMLLLGCAYFIGNIANQLLLNYFSIRPIILSGLILAVTTSVLMVILSQTLTLSISLMTVPVFFLFFCDGLIFANVLTHALQCYRQFPATAGALIGGLLNILGSLITYLTNHFFNLHSLFILSTTYCVILGLALTLFFTAFSTKLDNTLTNA